MYRKATLCLNVKRNTKCRFTLKVMELSFKIQACLKTVIFWGVFYSKLKCIVIYSKFLVFNLYFEHY